MRTMGLFPLEATAGLCSQGWKNHFLDSHADDTCIFDIPTKRSIRNILQFFKNYSISSILVQHHKLTKGKSALVSWSLNLQVKNVCSNMNEDFFQNIMWRPSQNLLLAEKHSYVLLIELDRDAGVLIYYLWGISKYIWITKASSVPHDKRLWWRWLSGE